MRMLLCGVSRGSEFDRQGFQLFPAHPCWLGSLVGDRGGGNDNDRNNAIYSTTMFFFGWLDMYVMMA